jgi:hypothetical protein
MMEKLWCKNARWVLKLNGVWDTMTHGYETESAYREIYGKSMVDAVYRF